MRNKKSAKPKKQAPRKRPAIPPLKLTQEDVLGGERMSKEVEKTYEWGLSAAWMLVRTPGEKDRLYCTRYMYNPPDPEMADRLEWSLTFEGHGLRLPKDGVGGDS